MERWGSRRRAASFRNVRRCQLLRLCTTEAARCGEGTMMSKLEYRGQIRQYWTWTYIWNNPLTAVPERMPLLSNLYSSGSQYETRWGNECALQPSRLNDWLDFPRERFVADGMHIILPQHLTCIDQSIGFSTDASFRAYVNQGSCA